jgi:hypothetical protein
MGTWHFMAHNAMSPTSGTLYYIKEQLLQRGINPSFKLGYTIDLRTFFRKKKKKKKETSSYIYNIVLCMKLFDCA